MRTGRARSRTVAAGAALVLAASIGVGAVTASAAVESVEPGTAGGRLSVAFYADTSCLLMIDGHPRVGRTLLDATLGDGESRTLIHCDTEDDRRLTLLARGVSLGRRERTALLGRGDIESGKDGVIAWLTRVGVRFPDESAPRRYLDHGDVFVRDTPQTPSSGAALHVDRREFARIEGELEALLDHPDGSAATID